MNTDLIQIEYAFSVAQAESHRARAEALAALLFAQASQTAPQEEVPQDEGESNNVAYFGNKSITLDGPPILIEVQTPLVEVVETPVEAAPETLPEALEVRTEVVEAQAPVEVAPVEAVAPSLPKEGEVPSLLKALQIVIGDADVTTVNQVFDALQRKDWVPIASGDPIAYVRHTLSKNKEVFLRARRGRYTLSAANQYKRIPTFITEEISEELPPTTVKVKAKTGYTAEEVAAAERVVDEVLALHAKAIQPTV